MCCRSIMILAGMSRMALIWSEQMVVRHLYAKENVLHSSDPLARQQMYQILYMHKPDDVKLFNHPVPIQTLEWIRKVKSS